MQRNVPKFASFAPKGPPIKQDTARSQHKSRSEQAQSHRHGHQSQGKESANTAIYVPQPSQRKEKAKPETNQTYPHGYTDELFEVDQHGDQDNVRFGTNSKWRIPAYREPYRSSLLGAERSRHSSVIGNPLAKLSRSDRARLQKDGRHIIPDRTKSDAQTILDFSEDFLPLRVSRKRKRGSPHSYTLGLSFRGNDPIDDAQPGESSAEESDEMSSAAEDQEVEMKTVQGNSALRSRLQLLQDRTKSSPSDADAWLDYIDFQDKWVMHGLASHNVEVSRDDSSVAGKLQLSIINEALKALGPTHAHRDALLLRRLDIGRRVWTRDKLEKEWHVALAQSQRSFGILLSYIEYRQSAADSFQWDAVKDLFTELIGSRLKADASQPEKTYSLLLEYTTRLTSFFRDSGFFEMSIAVWQLLIELSSSEATSDMQDSTNLASSWDLGAIHPGKIGLQSLTESIPLPQAVAWFDKIDYWAQDEISRMYAALMSACAADKLDDYEDSYRNYLLSDDDPYRTVLYSDVQAFVEKWPCYRQLEILIAFLSFCGLPTAYNWSQMPCAVEAYSDMVNLDMVGRYYDRTTGPFLPGKSWLAYTDTMFAVDDEVLHSFADVPRRSLLVKLAANVLENMTQASVKSRPEEGDMPEYFVALTLHLAPELARKMVKSLLNGGESSCMRLYHSLALIEARQKGVEAANRVFLLALKMSSNYVDKQPAEPLLLWHSWIREALSARDVGLALRRVASIGLEDAPNDLVLEDKPTHSQILRVRDYLRRTRDQALSKSEAKVAVSATQLLVTLTYLTTLNISSTAEVFRTNLTHFERYVTAASPIITMLHQHLAVLLYTHVTRRLGPYSPSDLADALLPSVVALPANGLILNVYAAIFTHGNRLDDRVRSAVRRVLHVDQQGKHEVDEAISSAKRMEMGRVEETSKSVVPHLFAIKTELSRIPELGTTSVSIRRAFERAIATPECMHSERIWSLYLDYECSLISKHSEAPVTLTNGVRHYPAREKAKSIFYRGLSALPWSKKWAMRAFVTETLGRSLSVEEKRAIVEGMAERGLRLHRELE